MATLKPGTSRRKSRPAGSAPTEDDKPQNDEQRRGRDAVATRLRAARDALRLTQRQVAERIRMPLPSYKDYEAGNRIPGGEALGLLILAGINANWLITGEGPMLMADLEVGDAPSQPPLDWKILGGVIEDIENRQANQDLDLAPEKKAQLIGLVYDYCPSTGKYEPSLLDRFLKLVTG
ncbi:MAG: helix-turn-helix transcriptional regulator [Rhodocyclaceae bacterium]|nr:helix-turn-helix transcriptional regulator [Rhodocyclaceae bacterium]